MRDELLAQGVAHHKAGRYPVAIALYERVLRENPDDADALQLCAVSRLRLGETARALALFDRALKADPSHVPAAINRARALIADGRPADAAKALAAIVKANPDRLEALRLLAEARLLAGDHKGAYKPYVESLTRSGVPNAELFVTLQIGARLRELGRAKDAVEAYTAYKGFDADVLLGLGNSKRMLGDHAGAAEAFKRALGLRPDFVEARHNLGQAWLALGRIAEGIAGLADAATRSTDTWPWISFVDAVAAHGVPDAISDEVAVELLSRAFAQAGVDHQALERATRALIDRNQATPFERHALFTVLLTRTIVTDPAWEARLCALRGALVDRAIAGDVDEPTLITLATQAWYGEHAWPRTAEDVARIASLRASADPAARLALATFEPLADDPWWRANPARAALIRLAVAEPAEEVRRAEALPVLALTEDATSAAVRALYEEHPYPRLASQHRKPAEPFPQVIRNLFPHVTGKLPGGDGALSVLVAGCGTGQQALAAATRYTGAQVLAIDLSRRSLGRASRQAAAWGLTNVTFAQADLLAIGDRPERYDLVESGGVLHHLADPFLGWSTIRKLLAPGGFMKIALYAERGRPAVIAARAFVEEQGFPVTPDGLRAARAAFLALPDDHPARPIVYSPDFYSLTGLRDLVFHVHEVRYTLPRLAREIAALGLVFVGFQHGRPEPRQWYREAFPDDTAQADLARWETVEDAHPHAFAGMYQFWVRDASSR